MDVLGWLFMCLAAKVSLPPKDQDNVLAPGIFNEGIPGPRHFDFSGAPDVDGFDPTSCPSDLTMNGKQMFYLREREKS